ncbi:MAG: hypothetical protein QNJ36_21435 [Calothrix sp. MO_167.B42]|nr:hypothetical protein [Calothrix sp. MO_167.B42]
MIDNERKRRILEHLQQTSNVKIKLPSTSLKSSEPKPAPAATPTPTPPPPPPPAPTPTITFQTPESRKKLVMQHLARSGVDFDLSSASLEKRKQKIKEHINKSTNKT